jgi:hypothetical protein
MQSVKAVKGLSFSTTRARLVGRGSVRTGRRASLSRCGWPPVHASSRLSHRVCRLSRCFRCQALCLQRTNFTRQRDAQSYRRYANPAGRPLRYRRNSTAHLRRSWSQTKIKESTPITRTSSSSIGGTSGMGERAIKEL